MGTLSVHLVVAVAVPLPSALFAHVTWVTPLLCDVILPSAKGEGVVLRVDVEVGNVMATAGGMASTPMTVNVAAE